MLQYNYYDKDAHIDEHKKFIDKIHIAIEELKKDNRSSADHLLQFFKTWVLNHVTGKADQKLGLFISKPWYRDP